jgi:branched-chain amino acid transport system substrate-binding protein
MADGAPRALASLVLVILAACTPSAPTAEPTATVTPTPTPNGTRPFVLRVVATLTGRGASEDVTFLDGIRLGERAVNREGVNGRPVEVVVEDDGGDPGAAAGLVREAVAAPGTAAVLVVGPAEPVVASRAEIEATRTPVVLLGGDLYSGRDLFRQAFQTSIPYRWQSAVLARYLVKDRGYDRVVLVTERGPAAAAQAFRDAMAEEDASVASTVRISADTSPAALAGGIGGADAVAYLGGPVAGRRLARAVPRVPDPPQLAGGSAALAEAFATADGVPPGTVAPYAYTWAGWADPIRRVGAFRELCDRRLDHGPQGFEQEGYDAVRVLAAGLRRSDGHGGDALVRAMESFDEELHSSLPIALGPDDHLFLSDRQLGLFAVAGAGEEVEPWAPEWAPWRPLMRTFTGNGERTTVIDRDKRVFFPAWRQREPAPNFWNARYGIATRRGDPLH